MNVAFSWYDTWEILSRTEPAEACFWATQQGAELDLLLFKNGSRIGMEVRRMDAPFRQIRSGKGCESCHRGRRVFIRATYQHCCLRYVMNEKMTNQSLRERFNLSEKKAEAVSRAIRDLVEAGKIKLADPEQASLRYRSYIPFWA